MADYPVAGPTRDAGVRPVGAPDAGAAPDKTPTAPSRDPNQSIRQRANEILRLGRSGDTRQYRSGFHLLQDIAPRQLGLAVQYANKPNDDTLRELEELTTIITGLAAYVGQSPEFSVPAQQFTEGASESLRTATAKTKRR